MSINRLTSMVIVFIVFLSLFSLFAFAGNSDKGGPNMEKPSELDRQSKMADYCSKMRDGIQMKIKFPARITPGSSLPIEIIFISHHGAAQIRDTFRPYSDNVLMVDKTGGDESAPLTQFGNDVFHPGPFSGSTTAVSVGPGQQLSCHLNAARLFDLSVPGKYTLKVSRHVSVKMDGGYHDEVFSLGPVPFVVNLSPEDKLEQRFMTDDARDAAADVIKSTKSTGLKSMTPEERRIVKEYIEKRLKSRHSH